MNPLKSQALGISLALATAIGLIFYEKLVNHFSFIWVSLIIILERILFAIVAYFIFDNYIGQDATKFVSEPKYWGWGVFYILTGCTGLLWYYITKTQGAMTGSLYEVKYIVMLALIYILFGDKTFNLNTAIGCVLALGSVYFVSKS